MLGAGSLLLTSPAHVAKYRKVLVVAEWMVSLFGMQVSDVLSHPYKQISTHAES